MSITVLAGTPPTADTTSSVLRGTLRIENGGGPVRLATVKGAA